MAQRAAMEGYEEEKYTRPIKLTQPYGYSFSGADKRLREST
jgi:hypothetical protein